MEPGRADLWRFWTRRRGVQRALVNPADAASASLADGALARIVSPRMHLPGRAQPGSQTASACPCEPSTNRLGRAYAKLGVRAELAAGRYLGPRGPETSAVEVNAGTLLLRTQAE